VQQHLSHLNVAATGTILATLLDVKRQWEGASDHIIHVDPEDV